MTTIIEILTSAATACACVVAIGLTVSTLDRALSRRRRWKRD